MTTQRHRLTTKQVEGILAAYSAPGGSSASAAAEYGVSRRTVLRHVRRSCPTCVRRPGRPARDRAAAQ